MVAQAHSLEQADQEERDAEEREHEECVERSYALGRETEEALDSIEGDPNLPIRVDEPNPRPADTQGWSGWDVWWLDPLPDRCLYIRMHHDDCELRWAWYRHPETSMRWHKEDVTFFSVDRGLRELLRKLCDHEAWKSRRLPGSE